MSINKSQLPKYHFFATEIDYKIPTNNKKILAGNWCHNHSTLEKEQSENIEIIKDCWENYDQKNKDYTFLQNIVDQYCEALTLYLNKYNKENFPLSFWRIVIFPWLSLYLSSQLYRWRLVNKILQERKSFSFFSFPDDLINKPTLDTTDYGYLIGNDNEFNYLHFKRILKYLKKKGHEIIFIDKLLDVKIINKNKQKNSFERIKFYFFEIIDNMLLSLSKNNNIYIEASTFRKGDYFKINFLLKQFPTFFQKLFKYPLENKNFRKFKVDEKKRIDIPFENNIEFEENNDFIQYINSSIRRDLPLYFLEAFSELKKSVEKIKISPKTIVSCFAHCNNDKFNLWIASNNLKNNSKIIFVEHGGGNYRKFPYLLKSERKIAHTHVSWVTPKYENEIQLPANKFLNFNINRKYKKYLSYVEHGSTLFPEKFGARQNIPESNLQNIINFQNLLNEEIFNKLIYLPLKIYNYGSVQEIKSIIKDRYINKPHSLTKYLNRTKLVVCSYPETPFYESILTGPTILLYNFSSDVVDEKFQKIYSELVKNKIAFSNPKDVSLHINEIWNDIDKWWSSKDVKNTINDLLLATCQIQDDSINIWAKFLKNEIKKNI